MSYYRQKRATISPTPHYRNSIWKGWNWIGTVFNLNLWLLTITRGKINKGAKMLKIYFCSCKKSINISLKKSSALFSSHVKVKQDYEMENFSFFLLNDASKNVFHVTWWNTVIATHFFRQLTGGNKNLMAHNFPADRQNTTFPITNNDNNFSDHIPSAFNGTSHNAGQCTSLLQLICITLVPRVTTRDNTWYHSSKDF